jgi:hypothetical protein
VREKKKTKYHCTENQNLNLNTERHRQTSLWIGFLIIRLFGNLSDNFIYKGNFSWLSDSQSHFWLSRLGKQIMITVAKHMIILVIIRSLVTPYAGPHKLFKSFLKLPCCFTVAEKKRSKAVISFEEWNRKSCSAALQFRTPFERFICFLSHVHLRPFSFILNAKAELMDKAAIDDYSSVRICLNANIPTCTFLFINRWC